MPKVDIEKAADYAEMLRLYSEAVMGPTGLTTGVYYRKLEMRNQANGG